MEEKRNCDIEKETDVKEKKENKEEKGQYRNFERTCNTFAWLGY